MTAYSVQDIDKAIKDLREDHGRKLSMAEQSAVDILIALRDAKQTANDKKKAYHASKK